MNTEQFMECADQDSDAGDRPSPTVPAGEGSVLLLSPAGGCGNDEGCVHFSTPSTPGEVDFLGVSLDESVDAVLDRWRRYAGELPARTAVVTVEGTVRSAAATAGGQPRAFGGNVTAASVSAPSDLTGLGIKISQVLSAWADDPNDLVVCFRSLTALLEVADVKRVFRFAHVLTQRVKTTGAVAHFHLDPEPFDEQTVATLRGLFDAVYELAPDGSWTPC